MSLHLASETDKLGVRLQVATYIDGPKHFNNESLEVHPVGVYWCFWRKRA